jgi:hypothetical protein
MKGSRYADSTIDTSDYNSSYHFTTLGKKGEYAEEQNENNPHVLNESLRVS